MPGPGTAGARRHDSALHAYLPTEATRLTGVQLLQWATQRFGAMVTEQLDLMAAQLGERLFAYPMAHVYTKRGGEWQAAWKVLSNGGITFCLTLAVEDADPATVHLRMTDHPRLWLPPLEVPGMVPMVQRHAPVEMVEAIDAVRFLEVTGYAVLKAKGWGVRQTAAA
jgi:hypothetical protein